MQGWVAVVSRYTMGLEGFNYRTLHPVNPKPYNKVVFSLDLTCDDCSAAQTLSEYGCYTSEPVDPEP